ncbi:MAG: hypothetical protein N2746_12305 [Deltaproteobacteria bacterium]|nr:hypothetical protein [Deltaproteobacteria bacterium]
MRCAQDIQIDIHNDAKDIGLSELIASLIKDNCNQNTKKYKIFSNLKGDVQIIAKDADISIILSFNKGKLTIYNGYGKSLDFAIKADSDKIIGLSRIKLFWSYPLLFNKEGIGIIKDMIAKDIEIKGILKRIIFGINLLRIISIY